MSPMVYQLPSRNHPHCDALFHPTQASRASGASLTTSHQERAARNTFSLTFPPASSTRAGCCVASPFTCPSQRTQCSGRVPKALDDARELVVLGDAWENGKTQEQFRSHAAKRPPAQTRLACASKATAPMVAPMENHRSAHVNSGIVRHSNKCLRRPIES